MNNFFEEQGRTGVYAEAYMKYVADENPRRMQLFGERAISGWKLTRSHLKIRILAQDRGGDEFQTAGILEYFEDLKRVANKDIEPKDIFEIALRSLRLGRRALRHVFSNNS